MTNSVECDYRGLQWEYSPWQHRLCSRPVAKPKPESVTIKHTKPVAYVQQDEILNGHKTERVWWSDNCEKVASGLRELGYEIRGFLSKELDKLPLTKDTLVRGNIRVTRRAFDLLGVKQPQNIYIPKELMKFANRRITATTLGAVRKADKAVFIKPRFFQKAFCGTVYEPFHKQAKRQNAKKYWNDYFNGSTKEFPDSFPVFSAPQMHVSREVRCFVLKGKLITHPNEYRMYAEEIAFAQEIVKAWKSAPISYCFDVAKMAPYVEDQYTQQSDYKLSLVEINMAYSAGMNWDISDIDYAEIAESYWFQLMKRPVPRFSK